jgi:glycosyltransferase involved in cell wall biosynthesis
MSKVDVIIPVYNMANTLGRAIDSVLSQTHKDFQLVIVDDGSEDEIDSVIEKNLRSNPDKIKVLRLEKNLWRATALNRGIQHTESKFVTFLDADDTLPEDSLEKRINFLEDHPELDAIFTDTNYLDKNGRVYSIKKPKKRFLESRNWAESYLNQKLKVPFSNPSIMYRKRVFDEKTKGLSFDETLKRGQDTDLVYSLLKSCNVGYLDSITYNYHQGTYNTSERIKNRIMAGLCKTRLLAKHTTGLKRVYLSTISIAVNIMKLAYETISYKK